MHREIAWAVSLILVACGSGTAFAQAQGRVVSTVLDERGAPLPGVQISATTKRTAMAGGECVTGAVIRTLAQLSHSN